MTAIYKKQGRRYVEIGKHEPEHYDMLPNGAHLVIVKSGTRTTHYNVQPADAAVEAALHRCRESITEAMREATKLRPSKRAYTAKEKAGWDAYRAIAGDVVALQFEGVSLYDVVDAAIKALRVDIAAQGDLL